MQGVSDSDWQHLSTVKVFEDEAKAYQHYKWECRLWGTDVHMDEYEVIADN